MSETTWGFSRATKQKFKMEPKRRREIKTWGDRLAWLGRMPMKYRILFGTQAIIFGLSIRFRLMDLKKLENSESEGQSQEHKTIPK